MAGLGSAEAATFGPPPAMPEVDFQLAPEGIAPNRIAPNRIAPAALGSPCLGSIVMADRQAMAFSIDIFTLGSNGYAPMGPPGAADGVLGLICRLADFPGGLK